MNQKYLVLRNCYVEDRYFSKGDVVKLPDTFPKNEKNFSKMRHQDTPKGSATCPDCGKVCLSELGLKSHARTHAPKPKAKAVKAKRGK